MSKKIHSTQRGKLCLDWLAGSHKNGSYHGRARDCTAHWRGMDFPRKEGEGANERRVMRNSPGCFGKCSPRAIHKLKCSV